MKIYLLHANLGDSYDSHQYIVGAFLSKKGLYKHVHLILNECSRKQSVRNYKGHRGGIEWLVEEEDGYNSTIYSMEEMEVGE